MRFTLPLLIVLAGCADFPALDGTIPPAVANAPPPDLVPLTSVFAQARAGERTADASDISQSSRLANLRGRAARLRGDVIAPAERARMLRGPR